MTVEKRKKLGALMNTEGNLEAVQKRLKYSTLLLPKSSQRLFQFLPCTSTDRKESSKQCGGKTGYDYLKKLKVLKSKESHEFCPRLWSKLTAVTVTALRQI